MNARKKQPSSDTWKNKDFPAQVYSVEESTVHGFVSLFDDRHPLHTDDLYARKKGFQERVAHGGILHGFISHYVGEVFPSKEVMLVACSIRYVAPNYVGDSLELRPRLHHFVEAAGLLELEFVFQNLTRKVVSARGTFSVKV